MSTFRRGGLAALLAGAAVAVCAGTGSPASANFGSQACSGTPRNCPSLANNTSHSLRFVSIDDIPNIGIATQWALDSVYDPTDLQAYRNDADTEPDVYVHDGYLNSGFVAYVDCPAPSAGSTSYGSDPYRVCRGQRLYYDSYYYFYDDEYDSQTSRRKVACHEIGHTVGLRHWNDYHSGAHSCMFNGATAATVEGLASHDVVDHINAYY